MTEYLMNRLANAGNPYQGDAKKVLCVCSAGLLRSPTAAEVLSKEPYNFNTRAAGLTIEFALIPVDEVLLSWADEIVCMSYEQYNALERTLLLNKNSILRKKRIINLDINDSYGFRDPELIELIKERYDSALAIKDFTETSDRVNNTL
jgi:predicted protein tyrosine phosphatase